MEHVNPNVGYVVLSYLLTKTRHNVVITTNFDHLTEDAVNYYAQTLPLIIGHESLAHYISKQITRPTIIKIHRDLLFDPKNTAKDVETLHEAWKEALNSIFSEYHPVFIGYAGNDNSLMDFLLENREQFTTGIWKYPYWLLYNSEVPNQKVRELIEGTEGYLINCNGFDEVLCLIGAELGYKMPTEEVFLNDAKNRYRKLTDAFENIISSKTTETNDSSQVFKSETSQSTETFQHAMQKIANQRDISTKYLNAVILHNQGKYEEAIILKRELVHEQPESARYHDSLGVTLHEQGRYEEAEEEKRKATGLEPENAGYHDGLGVTLHEQGRYEEAEEEIRRAVELEPENARYRDNLSVILHAQGRCEEAEKESRKAVKLEPETARYHNSLAATLYEQGRYEEAEEEKRRATELEPENARYHDSLGVTLCAQGKYEES